VTDRSAEILRLAAASLWDGAASGRLARVAGDVEDWKPIETAAFRHGLRPILLRALRGIENTGAVPSNCLERLQSECETTRRRNLYLAAELLEVIEALRSRGIEALALRGPAFALGLHGDIGLREFTDLDLLVRRNQIAAAAEVLEARGYRPRHRLSKSQAAMLLRHQCESAFDRDDILAPVELHWDVLTPPFGTNFDLDRIFRRQTALAMDDAELPVPSSEDALLMACAHGAKHAWSRLLWVADVAALMQKGIDWDDVAEEAERARADRMLRLGLLLAQSLFAIDLPDSITEPIRADRVSVELAQRYLARLGNPADAPDPYGERVFALRLQEGGLEKARYALRTLTCLSQSDLTAISLPDSLSFLYYVVRPFRLLLDVVRARRNRRRK
jgi:hypothetical protein